MSAARSQKRPKRAPASDLGQEGTLGPVPPSLPTDPAVRTELRQHLERGLASAQAGIGEDWEVVHARLNLPSVPPPLPTDPAVRAELFARLDRGIAEAHAGRDISWEDLDRRTRAKHGLPPA